MPCRSDYLEAGPRECALSKVMTFLDELRTGKFYNDHYRGYHPDVYNKSTSQELMDNKTSELCSQLKQLDQKDIQSRSLELQIWWRDHLEGERRRQEEDEKNNMSDHHKVVDIIYEIASWRGEDTSEEEELFMRDKVDRIFEIFNEGKIK